MDSVATSLGRCHICRSQRYTVNSSGDYVCEYGHVSLEYRPEEAENDFQVRANRQKRAKVKNEVEIIQSQNEVEDEQYLKDLQEFEGSYLKWATFQEIVFMQVTSLVRNHSFPNALIDATGRIWMEYFRLYIRQLDTEEEGDDIEEEREGIVQAKRTIAPLTSSPNNAIIFSYLGCVHLHLPVTLSDLFDMVLQGQVPLLGLKNSDLKIKFEHFRSSLLIKNCDPIYVSCNRVLRWLSRFNSNVLNLTHSINYPPILLRWIQEMLLPIEFFEYTICLLKKLKIDLSFDSLLDKIGTNPELLLLASLVVTIKLVYASEARNQFPSLKQLCVLWKLQHQRRLPIRLNEAFLWTDEELLQSKETLNRIMKREPFIPFVTILNEIQCGKDTVPNEDVEIPFDDDEAPYRMYTLSKDEEMHPLIDQIVERASDLLQLSKARVNRAVFLLEIRLQYPYKQALKEEVLDGSVTQS